jgi:hypothetical protein
MISIFQVPYAILIAAVVAVTDIIPVVGPFIGIVPAAVIILLTDPPKLIPFLLIILLIQQVEGNIISPKILGEQTGISSLCVIIAISVMGAIWGFAGMILGVPLFATVIELISDYLDGRLRKKGLPVQTEYYATDTMGKDGVRYPKRSGVCLETQFFPDAVHHPEWKQQIVKAGEKYHSVTTYRFSW